jgi:hypothetical protein
MEAHTEFTPRELSGLTAMQYTQAGILNIALRAMERIIAALSYPKHSQRESFALPGKKRRPFHKPIL